MVPHLSARALLTASRMLLMRVRMSPWEKQLARM
jgi:hypothetical protein